MGSFVKSIEKPTDIIFIGNPGSGKSTLCASISGIQFTSGVCFGRGLTKQGQFETDSKNKNIRWVDTPGLNDCEMIKDTATEITNVLNKSSKDKRNVKIIFVAMLDSGRIRVADAVTFQIIMNSIEIEYKNQKEVRKPSYSVIFNQLGSTKSKKWDDGKSSIEKMLRNEPIPTDAVMFIPKIKRIDGEDNVQLTSDELEKFGIYDGMNSAPSIRIKKAKTIDLSMLIDTDELERKGMIYNEQFTELVNQGKKTSRREKKNKKRDSTREDQYASEKKAREDEISQLKQVVLEHSQKLLSNERKFEDLKKELEKTTWKDEKINKLEQEIQEQNQVIKKQKQEIKKKEQIINQKDREAEKIDRNSLSTTTDPEPSDTHADGVKRTCNILDDDGEQVEKTSETNEKSLGVDNKNNKNETDVELEYLRKSKKVTKCQMLLEGKESS